MAKYARNRTRNSFSSNRSVDVFFSVSYLITVAICMYAFHQHHETFNTVVCEFICSAFISIYLYDWVAVALLLLFTPVVTLINLFRRS